MSGPASISPALPPLLAYPERRWRTQGALDRAGTAFTAALRSRATARRSDRLQPVVAATEALGPAMRLLSDAALREAARAAGAHLRRERTGTAATTARALAPICEAAARVLDQRPFAPQVLAAHACAQGLMVEMATGEGKTLAAALAATLIALTGTPVHLLTVNRYLAERDAAFAAPLYGFFGLGVRPRDGGRAARPPPRGLSLPDHRRGQQGSGVRLHARPYGHGPGARQRAAQDGRPDRPGRCLHRPDARGAVAARPLSRDRRRGRQRADRRGADAAGHLVADRRPAALLGRVRPRARPLRRAAGRRRLRAHPSRAPCRAATRRARPARRIMRGRGRSTLGRGRRARAIGAAGADRAAFAAAGRALSGPGRPRRHHRRVHRPGAAGPDMERWPARADRAQGGTGLVAAAPGQRAHDLPALRPPLSPAERPVRNAERSRERAVDRLRRAGRADPDIPARSQDPACAHRPSRWRCEMACHRRPGRRAAWPEHSCLDRDAHAGGVRACLPGARIASDCRTPC